MPVPRSGFVFATCQVGAEIAVKADVARAWPGLRPGFQRPGLVTFVAEPSWNPVASLGSPFVRACGASAGPAASVDAVVAAVRSLGEAHLFVFPRDVGRPGHEPPALVEAAQAHAAATEAALRATRRFLPARPPKRGEAVVDVITAIDEPALVGWHVHGPAHVGYPGGRFPIEVPADAPSRSWGKIAEAAMWAELPFRAGDVAVEIGDANGGAAAWLLQQGLSVWVTDGDPLDPRLVASAGPRLHHVRKMVRDVTPRDLPDRAQWLLLDLAVSAPLALRAVRPLVPRLRRDLCGFVFMLKLSDWSLARHLGGWTSQLREMGAEEIRFRQLVANRREVCAVGLTAAGMARCGRSVPEVAERVNERRGPASRGSRGRGA